MQPDYLQVMFFSKKYYRDGRNILFQNEILSALLLENCIKNRLKGSPNNPMYTIKAGYYENIVARKDSPI